MKVCVGGRTFTVTLLPDGRPASIKERKVYAPGKPYEAIYHSAYWHKSMKLGGPKTMPRRILEAAGVHVV